MVGPLRRCDAGDLTDRSTDLNHSCGAQLLHV
jgi:hypothetical protein